MTKLPLFVWCVGDPAAAPNDLHEQLEPLVEHYRIGSAHELADRLAGSATVPDVALIERWDARLAEQFDDLPRVWLDPRAADHDEIAVAAPVVDARIGHGADYRGQSRPRAARSRCRSNESTRRLAPSRQPLPDLDDFALHFQAQWSIDGSDADRCRNAAALERSAGAERCAPEAMVATAEQRGDMRRLGDWIITRACRHAADWRFLWPDPMRLLINISPLQLAADDFVEVLGGGARSRTASTLR